MRVLIAEDDDKIASFIVKGLKQAGFAVDRSADGEEGLYLAVNHPYDAAVIDILLARIQALIRRSSQASEPTRLTAGDLSMDLLTREIVRGDRKIDLQPREFALLEYLMHHAGKVVSKSMIMEHVWSYDFDPQTNVVDVLVCRLRNKIDRDFEKKMIHTQRGVGYALKTS